MNQNNDVNSEVDKVMEGFYHYIGYHHVENTAKSLDAIKEEAGKIDYPKELDDWFYDYLRNSKKAEKRSQRIIQIKAFSKRVAILLLFLGISMSVMMLSVDAFRIKVFNFITDITERYTSIQVEETKGEEEESSIQDQWKDYFLPEYIPSGYQLVNTQIFGNNKIIYYKSEDGNEIQFSQATNDNNFQIDTENATSEEITINTQKGIMVEKNKMVTLLWTDNDHTFYIIGKTDKNELVKMAESIKIKK